MDKPTFEEKRSSFVNKFEQCQPALSAVGDETRQLIIRTLIEHSGQGGLRVGAIQANTSISRTAVSHHLKVLKDAGIITVRRQGTMNFYLLDPLSSSLKNIAAFWKEAEEMAVLCHTAQKKEKTEK